MNAKQRKQLAAFTDAVRFEVYRAEKKFRYPNPNLAALMGEAGELAQAMLQGKSAWEIYQEAVQVAAMAARCAIEGDPQFSKRVKAI